MEELVTVQEVADYLKMSPQTIYRFAQQGRIPALKVGSRWRFRPADIETWLQQQDDRVPSILVVDDEVHIGQLFSAVLENKGYRITVTHSGDEAVEAVRRRRYALIFLDLMMPGMNGLETIQAIRQIDSETKIVIVTGYQDSTLLKQALQLGPFTVLSKPCDGNQILNTVSMLVS
jgi:excisionase family DNA binding protein